MLVFGYGFQTWEYAAQYAIRSWAFLMPYCAVLLLLETNNKVLLFYFARACIALFTTFCQHKMLGDVRTRYGQDIARLAMLFICISPGTMSSAAGNAY